MKKGETNNPKIKKGEQPPWLKGRGFDAHPENINKKGAPPRIGKSIDRELKRILNSEGEILLRNIEVCDHNGEKSGEVVKFGFARVANAEAVAVKLAQMLDSKSEAIVMKAAELIADRTEGRPKQQIEVGLPEPPPIADMTEEQIDDIVAELVPFDLEKELSKFVEFCDGKVPTEETIKEYLK